MALNDLYLFRCGEQLVKYQAFKLCVCLWFFHHVHHTGTHDYVSGTFQGRGLRLVSQKATLLLTTLYNTLLGVDTLHDMPLYEADTPSQHPLAHVDMV